VTFHAELGKARLSGRGVTVDEMIEEYADRSEAGEFAVKLKSARSLEELLKWVRRQKILKEEREELLRALPPKIREAALRRGRRKAE
jgi:hypothetical protein